jgi:transposase InsO family protein
MGKREVHQDGTPLSQQRRSHYCTAKKKIFLAHLQEHPTGSPLIAFPTTIDLSPTAVVTDSEEEDQEEPNKPIPQDQPAGSTKTTPSRNAPSCNATCGSSQRSHRSRDNRALREEPAENHQMRETLTEATTYIRDHPVTANFDQINHDIRNDNPSFMNEQQEYMHWHYKLNHASQKVMTKLAKKGMLPRHITKILKTLEMAKRSGPMCNDCYSASATRTAWRDKPNKQQMQINRERRKNLKPGDVVSVDQLESSTPGFAGQMTGNLTRQRIMGSTIFVDHASGLSYVYNQLSMSSEETINAKEAFENYAKQHGVHINHYHADNGRFKDRAFTNAVRESGQTLSFAAVGAHHQNGVAEKRIGDLQRRATTLLLHAERRWPDAINTHLWPYALRAANDARNNAPTYKQDECPISKFCSTARLPSLKNQHHFGCPVYVLSKEIQDGKKARKWKDRTRVGINLGYSPRHAHSVSLILNLETGLVSPQFHCSYDDLFETTTGTQARSIPRSRWQYKSGLVLDDQEDQDQQVEQDRWESGTEEEEDEDNTVKSSDEGASEGEDHERH